MNVSDQIYVFYWQSMTENNCNTYLIDGPTKILIDPGHAHLFGHVERKLDEIGVKLSDIGLILCTHVHPDHVEAIRLFKDFKTLKAIHESEWELAQSFFRRMQTAGSDPAVYSPDFLLKEGDLNVDGIEMKIFHTPGHSPGSVCIYMPDTKTLFTGDLIFKQGIGRTDLPGGNGSLLKQSIQRMAQLNIDCILPGHMEIISGKEKVMQNFEEIEEYWFRYV